jgi:hypothetical protein
VGLAADQIIFSARGGPIRYLASVPALGARLLGDIIAGKDREFFMRIFRLAAAITLLASPALAQVPPVNLLQDKPSKTQEEKDAEAARDKAYQDSLKKIPDVKAPADPWGNVRSTDAPKAAAKSASSAKSKAKTGNSAN